MPLFFRFGHFLSARAEICQKFSLVKISILKLSDLYRCYIFYLAGNGTNVIYNHTYYNCTSPLDNINFRDAKIVGSLLPLGVVCLMVILGNIMVITAIRITKKLRGATNMFIGKTFWAIL